MPKRVRTKPNARNSQLLPEYLEIPFKVPNGDLCIVFSAKEIFTHPHIALAKIAATKYRLAKLKAKGYKPMFSALAEDSEHQIFQITVFCRQSKHLTRPKPRVKNSKGNQMSPRGINYSWLTPELLKVQKAVNLLARKRR